MNGQHEQTAQHDSLNTAFSATTRSSRRFWVMVIIQAVLVFGLLASAVAMNITITRYQDRNSQLNEYRGRLNEIHLDLLAMQSSLRGYIATDEDLLLTSYQEALPRLESQFQYMLNSAILQEERRQTLNQLRIDIAQWQINYAEQAIAQMQQGNLRAAEDLIGQSQLISENLLERTENLRQQLVTNSDDLNQTIRLLDVLLLITVIVLAVLLLISTAFLMQFWHKQHSLMDELQGTSDNLQTRNNELRISISAQELANRRLHDRIQESRLINQINEMMVSTSDPAYLFPQVAIRIGKLLNGWCSILLEPEPSSTELTWKGLFYPEPEKLELIRDFVTQAPVLKTEGLHGPIFTENQSSIILINVPPAIRNPEDLAPELRPLAEAINLRSYIAIPIISKKRPIGLISVASSITDYHFEPEQELFLEHIADRISVWLERIELLNLAEQRTLELQISFDNIPDSIITYNKDGEIIRINQTAQAFFGSSENAIAYNWRTFSGQTLPTSEYPHIQALKGIHVRDAELYIMRDDYQPIIHAISAEPIISSNGNINGAVLIARDITNRKELERLKDEFLANMSHELRTPLTAILGYSELLLRRRTEALTDWHRSKLEGVQIGGQRLLNLVNDLLDVAKLEAGQVELEYATHNINDIIMAQYQLLKPNFQEKHIRFDNKLDPHMIDTMFDSERLNQVILNLLSNALKFTPEHGRIRATSRIVKLDNNGLHWKNEPLPITLPQIVDQGEYILVSIQDSGIGIAVESLPHLWDRFYQVEGGASRRFGGTGLGLSIVHQLIMLHSGYIWAESMGEDQGSCFIFMLPNKYHIVKDPVTASEGPTIFIIQDDPVTLDLYQTYLGDSGYQVVQASMKQDVIKMAPHIRPAAIILDLGLPDTIGWDVLAQLREYEHLNHIPVIIASMFDQTPIVPHDTYSLLLKKPISRDDLLANINGLLTEERRKHGYILVVDDDPAMSDLLKTTLEEYGYNVQTAMDGGLALDILQTQQLPSLILLDLMMPIVDGFQLLARIRNDQYTQDIPVLIITARDLSTEEMYKLRTTSQGIQAKQSLNIDTLVAKVQHHVPIQEGSSNVGSDGPTR